MKTSIKLHKIFIFLTVIVAIPVNAMFEHEYGYDWAEEPQSPFLYETDGSAETEESQRQFASANMEPEYDNFGRYPIHIATWEGKKERVKELLAQGTDPNMVERTSTDENISQGNTPLHYAVSGALKEENTDATRQNYLDIITMLINANADPYIKNEEDQTAYEIGLASRTQIPEVYKNKVLQALGSQKLL